MNFIVPTSWRECSEYQLSAFASLYIDPKKEVDIISLLQVLFCSNNTFFERLKFWHLIHTQLPASRLLPYLDFLKQEPTLYHFPDIKGLKKPSPRLSSLTIKQFSVCDAIFYKWTTQKQEVYLRQLVASLYTFSDTGFSELNLEQVATITDKIPIKQTHRIAFAFLCCRNYIVKQYPKIFKPTQEKEQDPETIVPQFTKTQQPKYQPFNDIILALSCDQVQPLGRYQEAKHTPVYEFFNVLTHRIKTYEALEKYSKSA